jgi:hypothetical protein
VRGSIGKKWGDSEPAITKSQRWAGASLRTRPDVLENRRYTKHARYLNFSELISQCRIAYYAVGRKCGLLNPGPEVVCIKARPEDSPGNLRQTEISTEEIRCAYQGYQFLTLKFLLPELVVLSFTLN